MLYMYVYIYYLDPFVDRSWYDISNMYMIYNGFVQKFNNSVRWSGCFRVIDSLKGAALYILRHLIYNLVAFLPSEISHKKFYYDIIQSIALCNKLLAMHNWPMQSFQLLLQRQNLHSKRLLYKWISYTEECGKTLLCTKKLYIDNL